MASLPIIPFVVTAMPPKGNPLGVTKCDLERFIRDAVTTAAVAPTTDAKLAGTLFHVRRPSDFKIK
jgi:hypothetical protein